MSASASASACLAFRRWAWASRSWASVSGDEIMPTTCPAVTSSPSFRFSVANRPEYFAATSTSVASTRPFDLMMPSGIVRPCNFAMRLSTFFRTSSTGFGGADWACALSMSKVLLENPCAHPAIDMATQKRADAPNSRTDLSDVLLTVRAPDRSQHKVTTRRKKLHRFRDVSGSQLSPRPMISLMETQKLSHCIGRTVVRLLREPPNLVECSHRGSRRVIYGTIIAFELQQLI